jgi:limonene-1,2-epoxide hydrolase
LTPEEIVRAELDAWGRINAEEIMSHFTIDALWENVPIGAVSGHEDLQKAVGGWVSHITSFDAEILNLAVAGNVVLTERVDHVVMDGRVVNAWVMGAFETEGDKIVAWRDYFDMGGHA